MVKCWLCMICSVSIKAFTPRFLRRYANLGEEITRAVQAYIEDVKSQDFPNEKEQY